MNDPHSLIGPYITDALEDDERETFEQHLEHCEDCRAEVLDLREAMAEVSALHESAPPSELRSSILDTIATTSMLPAGDSDPVSEDAEDPAPQDEVPARHDTHSNVVNADFNRSPRRPISTWLAAAAAILAVALGGVTLWQQSELRSVQAAEAQRVQLLAADDLQVSRTTLEGADLTYLASPSLGEAMITTTEFPEPEAEDSWQVWVVSGGVPRSAAVLDDGGQLQLFVEDVAAGDVLAITNEPRGGSPQPTGDIQADVEVTDA